MIFQPFNLLTHQLQIIQWKIIEKRCPVLKIQLLKGIQAIEIFCLIGEKKRFENTCKPENEYFAG